MSVFAGDPELGLGEDEEAIRLWEAKGVPPERIVRLGRADNFGPSAAQAPAALTQSSSTTGRRRLPPPECAPGCDCERYLEFWNLVFMEYELHPDGRVTPLPKQNVDTGMGLERSASILQGVLSVYETDGYQAIMEWIASESGVAYGESETATKAHRVLADHGRGMTFMIADGVRPSNEGRGYVLRRIIRRAIVHGHDIGLRDFLPGLADVVVEQMGDAYAELVESRQVIHEMLAAEEGRFGRTLEFGEGSSRRRRSRAPSRARRPSSSTTRTAIRSR